MLEDHFYRLELRAGKSNIVLADKDLHVVRGLLADTQLKLAELDQKISAHQPAPRDLLDQRAFLRNRMARFHVALSPHKFLPPEILARIFSYCLEDMFIRLPPHPRSAPWNIGSVCSRWRDIAYSEPYIWRNIDVDYTITRHGRKLTNVAHQVLSRSRGSTISLVCKEQLPLDEPFRLTNKPISTSSVVTFTRQLILRHAASIQNLDLSCTISTLVPVLEASPAPMESLESVRISIEVLRRRSIETLTQNQISVFGITPKLRRVEFISSSHLRILPDGLHLPWSQLTHLCFVNVVMPYIMTLNVLTQCDRLVTCFLSLAGGRDYIESTSRPRVQILVPLLSSLTIREETTPLFADLLDSISLPSLKILKIENTTGRLPSLPQILPQTELLSMIERSGCSLEEFSCRYPGAFDIPLLLHSMPDLRSLTITGRPIDIAVIEMMEHDDLVTKLESIESELTSINPFLDLLETRWLNADFGSEDHRPYPGIHFAKVQVYNLGDRLIEEANRRLETLRPQFQRPGRSISISLSSNTTWAYR